jgi:peptide/nickel transport system substrate-binding protein
MKRSIFFLMSLLVVASMVLAACGAGGGAKAVVQTEGLTETKFAPVKIEAPNCDYGGEYKSIEAVDESTVKFTLCYPDPAFKSKVAMSNFSIQPKEWLEKTGGTGDLLEKPVGTGPYYVAEWKRGDQLIFKKFDGYWGEQAKTPTVVFRWSSESAQRLLELQSGTVDGIDNVGPDDFAKVEADTNLKLYKRQAMNIMYIGMNNAFAPFDNELVRQAISYAIDRKRIVDNFYPAGSEVADYFTPCSIPNGCVGDKWPAFDVAKAKDLLAQAGYNDANPFPAVKLNYRDVVRGYLPQPGVVAQDIQAQLKANLGIDVNIEVMESGAYLDAADSGQLEGLYLLGWGADYPDQTNFLDYHFGATASKQFGAKFDDITSTLKQAAALADDAARKPLYEKANNLLIQHVPMVPVAHGGSGVAYKSTVSGGFASPLGNEEMYVMSVPGQDTFVWMQNAEPISLYCPDETDGESLRACEQVTESLLGFEIGGTAVTPKLAEKCEANADLTEWTCTLRKNVKFHNGFTLDAGDVVASFNTQWDAASPLHKGNTGAFTYWNALFGQFLNAPK